MGVFVRFFLTNRRCTIKELAINEEIRAKEVRLIDADGKQLGIVPLDEANFRAEEVHLDLVMISPNAEPPVCRLMDYGKYRYEAIKKQREQRKNQKSTETREIRLSPRIDSHDLETKAKKAIEILQGGDKIKVSVRFRGRELGHTEYGKEVLDQLLDLIADYGQVDKSPKMEGRSMVMFLSPKSGN
ncbi:MAG: translation initiation factor IF-3 [Peptoniphilaceae bacterium]|nr:translation initiation factor IF-3 [Peptoniphilaceae bacterium]MDD7542973.1 translation initiation factor IF-3 [Peptoniphilaceae bacterium]MDY5765343.1 translation initiation factor IF-3 [Peptoniphilaceae bacterium]MDY6145934.1 translation initiation factor IF-3 [Peptoniphilaceae bacterium]